MNLSAIHTTAQVPGQTHTSACTERFKLCQLREHEKDKLGHNVLDIILVGRNGSVLI